MKAQMILTIDLGEVGGHNYDQIEHKVAEVMEKLPFNTLDEFKFELDGSPVKVKMEVITVGDEEDHPASGHIDGDDAMMTSKSGFHLAYFSEKDLEKHLDELGVGLDSL